MNLYKQACNNVSHDKTNSMIFVHRTLNSHNYKIIINRNLLFNGHIIKQVHCVKCLGVNIDDELNWSEHINFLVGKVSSMIGIMYRNKHYLPFNCKKNIYFDLIYSNLTYCIEVYANTNKSLLKPLITTCNRLLRLLQNKPRRTSLYVLYSTFNTLPIDLFFNYYTMKFIHRCLYDTSNMPTVVSNW